MKDQTRRMMKNNEQEIKTIGSDRLECLRWFYFDMEHGEKRRFDIHGFEIDLKMLKSENGTRSRQPIHHSTSLAEGDYWDNCKREGRGNLTCHQGESIYSGKAYNTHQAKKIYMRQSNNASIPLILPQLRPRLLRRRAM